MRWELTGRRPRQRPISSCRDVLTEDMKVFGVREEDAENRDRWRSLIRSGDP